MPRTSRVYYHPGTFGVDPISLDGFNAYIDYGDGLRSHEWSRVMTSKTVGGLTLNAREVDVSVKLTDAAANNLRRVADADAANKTPGTLVVDDEWKIRCYIVASETSEVYFGWIELKLTLALIDSYWWRKKSRHFVTGLANDGLDYPHDYPHDYSFAVGEGQIEVDSLLGAMPLIRFYGAAPSPYVTIGGNRYEIDITLNSNQTATIDATTARPTVTLTDNYGNTQSIFAAAVRDGGLGGGSYAFEPFKHGVLQVSWSGAFAFDVEWVERDTEPPWSR